MANIVSSAVTSEAAQADGRKWFVETHTDLLGKTYTYRYLAAANVDSATILASRAIQLAADLKSQELTANILQATLNNSSAVTTNNYCTEAESDAAIRAAYLTATDIAAAALGSYLSSLSNARLMAAFGLSNNGQVTSLRNSQLTPKGTLMSSIHSSTGG